MAKTISISISSDEATPELTRLVGGDGYDTVNNLRGYFKRLMAGTSVADMTVTVTTPAVAAGGIVRCASVAAANTLTINATAFTCVDKRETTEITCVADVAGSLNSKYFTFSAGGTDYYVWYSVNAAGVDPAVALKTGIPVSIATDATAAAVATATQVAIAAAASANTTATVLTTKVTLVNVAVGNVTSANNGAASPVFVFSVTNGGTVGADQFQVSSDNDTCATNLAAAINANVTIAALLSATAVANTVVLTAVTAGTAGNAITTVGVGGIAADAATLTNGAAAATAETESYEFG